MTFQERDLVFVFPDDIPVEKFDPEGRKEPQGWKAVDFIVEEDERILLIEVTDPSSKSTPSQERDEFVGLLKGDLINHELVPKCRDSYCHLHLMDRDKKPMVYIVLLGLEGISYDLGSLPNFKDRLLRRLRQEADEPWKRKYVSECVVLTLEEWPDKFKNYLVKRV